MSNYTKQISWSGKDALSDSDSEKVISGGDFDTEFSAVQTAINSKIDGGTITNFTSTGIDDNATSTAITIDASENVGIGVVPEAWHSSYSAFQAGATSLTGVGFTQANFTANAYYDSTDSRWEYINSAEASQLQQTAGTHQFKVASSGTADAAITWTTGFEITNGGFPKSERTYANTTASSANMVVESAYTFARSVSSAKHKKDIETMQDSYADVVLQMRPVWFKSKCDLDNPDWGYWGLIAEEVAELDPRLVFWQENEYIDKEFSKEVTIPAVEEQLDSDGNIVVEAQPERTETVTETEKVAVPLDTPEAEGVQYDRIIPHLINLLKRQDTTIKDLTTRIEALEV